MSTDPLHSPPTAMPCSDAENGQNHRAPDADRRYDGTRPTSVVAIPIRIIVVTRSAFRPMRSPK